MRKMVAAAVCLFIVGSVHTAWTADKVVVIPLNSASRIAELEARIAVLEALLAGVVRTAENELSFTGMNVRVVNGTGTTNGAEDGLGNLIVGYNEERTSGNVRTGSHNIIVGRANNYSSYGGIVVGYNNTIAGAHSSVTGGGNNISSGNYSSVSGGTFNEANDWYSSISGGYSNEASGSYSSVSGGYSNTASGNSSSVSGGANRTVSGPYDWAAGTLFEDF